MLNSKIRYTLTAFVAGIALIAAAGCAGGGNGGGNNAEEKAKTDIKVYVDGSEVDIGGAEGYIIDGKPYLPVDAVAKAMGKESGWDEGTGTVYIVSGDKAGKASDEKTKQKPENDADAETAKGEGKTADTQQSSGAMGLTKEAFNAIKTGMTYDEIVNIIGFDGDLLSEDEYQAMYKWSEDEFGPSINIILRGGKVVQKSQWQLD